MVSGKICEQSYLKQHCARPVPGGGRQVNKARGLPFTHKVPVILSLNIIVAETLADLQATLQAEYALLWCACYTEP